MHCSDGNKYPAKPKETRALKEANCEHLSRIWKIAPSFRSHLRLLLKSLSKKEKSLHSLCVECPLAVSVGVVMELEYTTELGAKLSAWRNN